MLLSKRIHTAIKVFLTAFIVAGFAFFGFSRVHSAVHAASLQPATQSNALSSTCGSWSVIASPNFETKASYLTDVAAVSASNVWATGIYTLKAGISRTLIEHWNGKKWSLTPRPAVNGSSLEGIAALTSGDVWAVGQMQSAPGAPFQTLIEQWNGTSWSVVSSPNTLYADSLSAVAAISANDIWAAGYAQDTSGIDHTLFEHWDGSQWSIITSPDAGSNNNVLHSIAAVSSSDVWAVGTYQATPGSNPQTLVEHWDGTQWSIVASPNVGTSGSGLSGVIAVAANNIWAVGFYTINSGSGINQTLVEHWNGSVWNIVSSPNVGPYSNSLAAITSVSANNVWAVGSYVSGANPNPPSQTLIEHWDGTQWSVVSSPSPANLNNYLQGVTRVPGTGKLWAAGYMQSTTQGTQTLAEYYC